MAGDFDYFLKVRVRDMADFNRLHGAQLIAQQLPGGVVANTGVGEYGRTELTVTRPDAGVAVGASAVVAGQVTDRSAVMSLTVNAGAGALAQGASGKLKVGLMLPYTGTFAQLGVAIENGVLAEGGSCDPTNPCTVNWLDTPGVPEPITIPVLALCCFVFILGVGLHDLHRRRVDSAPHISTDPQPTAA